MHYINRQLFYSRATNIEANMYSRIIQDELGKKLKKTCAHSFRSKADWQIHHSQITAGQGQKQVQIHTLWKFRPQAADKNKS